ncbi:unnamed protein product [Dovyalis caffra]|uniref:Uncharacterized protein n=1 Tax=Dovyalis caffra TaxID=77055 RepID=A0AAV1R821_9ROSI|nr:unnamed protein product [Dovyalis caffra]
MLVKEGVQGSVKRVAILIKPKSLAFNPDTFYSDSWILFIVTWTLRKEQILTAPLLLAPGLRPAVSCMLCNTGGVTCIQPHKIQDHTETGMQKQITGNSDRPKHIIKTSNKTTPGVSRAFNTPGLILDPSIAFFSEKLAKTLKVHVPGKHTN